MGGQVTREREKHVLMAFQRRIGAGIANVRRNEFPHIGETISPVLRNHFEKIAKQCLKLF